MGIKLQLGLKNVTARSFPVPIWSVRTEATPRYEDFLIRRGAGKILKWPSTRPIIILQKKADFSQMAGMCFSCLISATASAQFIRKTIFWPSALVGSREPGWMIGWKIVHTVAIGGVLILVLPWSGLGNTPVTTTVEICFKNNSLRTS